jgi:hypothetical protein
MSEDYFKKLEQQMKQSGKSDPEIIEQLDTLEDDQSIDLSKYREDARMLVRKLYKDEKGDPIILTDGQCDMFNVLYKKLFHRVHIQSHTRYGKSLVIALAVLTRLTAFPEKWSIVAGNKEKATIIMSYIIQHIFDNPITHQRFKMEKGESEESIRRYRNKNRINFDLGGNKLGEVYITASKAAMGFGAPNVVLDEAALVPDDEEAQVFRMLGDQVDNYYFKIGNPWESQHFRSSYENPKYKKLIIDYKKGIEEGRLSLDMIEEARRKPFFDVLFECKFPPRDAIDDEGWMSLLTKDDIDKALISEGQGFGINKLGGDVAGEGKNFSVLVQRYTNLAKIKIKSNNSDTITFAEKIMNIRKRENISPQDVSIDKVGAGLGAYQILNRYLEGVIGVNAGTGFETNTQDHDLYVNLRAKMFWLARQWILKGGKLLIPEGETLENTWYQLTRIKYRRKLEGKRGKLEIMPKIKMLKEGIESPDVADAFALTFATQDIPRSTIEQQQAQEEVDDKFGFFPTI